ncbi:PspC domain-containing protein [Flammeovirga kamogawensis]|uniref:PspC domain-containing protein n=1 Tax=Flammeovirga kamogawensis TaxID=373891 RepID=UPI0011830705|nr:PspC family transcriptional regulator [Flammeovirga kamogawensis]MBB6463418.1 phage shock protein PspC (stress-responsive transcriptional regulator) [Flammeovirga kamogawensis]TRX67486.1 PspC family transcriptional regulator [Flammeovirga kamogawensis]
MNTLLFQKFIEKQAFGVCSKLGKKLNIASNSIRLYFIYASLFTFGSPIILYFSLHFFINIRKYIRQSQNVREKLF